MHTVAVVIAFLILENATWLQGDEFTPESTRKRVEIIPGTFADVEQWDWTVDDPRNTSKREKTRLRIRRDNKNVEWMGAEIPILLRERNDVLYLVGYDRE